MKTDRLIGILSILLQKDKVTAGELAELFEVSRRTVMRDVEALCRAGIPVVTRQGPGGGISIMEGYRFNRTALTDVELRDILAGLRGLDSVSVENVYKRLMDKLSAGSSDFMTGDQSLLIDLSSWYKDTLAAKIRLIRHAIDAKSEIGFEYFSQKGQSSRSIEPYYLIFRWSSWYVWGWCTARRDYRLFKLNRMDGLRTTGRTFVKRMAPMPDLSNERIFPGGTRVRAVFEPECKWRLVEEFGAGCFDELPDGRLLFHADYTSPQDLLTWILTFRDRAELLEPEELREQLRSTLAATLKKYEEVK